MTFFCFLFSRDELLFTLNIALLSFFLVCNYLLQILDFCLQCLDFNIFFFLILLLFGLSFPILLLLQSVLPLIFYFEKSRQLFRFLIHYYSSILLFLKKFNLFIEFAIRQFYFQKIQGVTELFCVSIGVWTQCFLIWIVGTLDVKIRYDCFSLNFQKFRWIIKNFRYTNWMIAELCDFTSSTYVYWWPRLLCNLLWNKIVLLFIVNFRLDGIHGSDVFYWDICRPGIL